MYAKEAQVIVKLECSKCRVTVLKVVKKQPKRVLRYCPNCGQNRRFVPVKEKV